MLESFTSSGVSALLTVFVSLSIVPVTPVIFFWVLANSASMLMRPCSVRSIRLDGVSAEQCERQAECTSASPPPASQPHLDQEVNYDVSSDSVARATLWHIRETLNDVDRLGTLDKSSHGRCLRLEKRQQLGVVALDVGWYKVRGKHHQE